MSQPITGEQLRAAYDALGLDPDTWNDTMRIVIAPHEVTVTQRLRNDAGHLYVVGDEIASDTTVLDVMW